jgi:hypothetical protein
MGVLGLESLIKVGREGLSGEDEIGHWDVLIYKPINGAGTVYFILKE